ncbi:MAG: hypothetical protein NW237_17750 [Cyanobacteriota bacterium]|nr:hypothetical protein [Cyanobacteriota bacterium]
MGSIISDLLRVEEGIYIVKVQILLNNSVLASGLAGSTTVEEAEDAALQRALTHAGLSASPVTPPETKPSPPFAALNVDATPLLPDNGIPTSWAMPTKPEVAIPAPPELLSRLPEPLTEPEDLSEIIAQSDVELQRIGWGPKEGREFLESRFHKKSRHQLNEMELREFLRHLKQQPSRPKQETPF